MTNSYLHLEEIPAWELEEYADGNAAPQVAAFFESHPAKHAQWLAEIQMFDKLKKRLLHFECPALETLQRYHWNDLLSQEKLSIDSHLQRCPTCAEELATLRKFVPLDHTSTQPSPTLRNRIRDSLAQLQAKINEARIAVAHLVTPASSPLMPEFALGSLRGSHEDLQESKRTLSPLIYEYEETTIIITIRPGDADRKNIQGQLLTALPEEDSWITLIPASPLQQDLSAKPDAVGNFEFSSVAEDTYQMLIILGEHTIVIPNLATF